MAKGTSGINSGSGLASAVKSMKPGDLLDIQLTENGKTVWSEFVVTNNGLRRTDRGLAPWQKSYIDDRDLSRYDGKWRKSAKGRMKGML